MDTQNFNQASDAKPQETVTEERGKEIHHHHYYYSRETRHRVSNFGKLFFGLLLLFFGIAYLAKSLGLAQFNINFTWTAIISVLVIVAGLSMISFRGWLGGAIGLILVFILAGIVLFMAFTPVNFWQAGSRQHGTFVRLFLSGPARSEQRARVLAGARS